jgi:HSP20 family molecular chaperone IbpA
VPAKGRHRRGSDDAMSEDEVVWPTGMSDQDPAARERPLVFNPEGFLVAILEDADQAEQARVALAEAGFAETNLRVYTSQQILDSWERFQAERSLAQRVAGAITDDPDTLELYFGSARQGRAALWVHVPDEADAKKAIRALADHQVLHIRHYGHDRQDDLHIG